MRGSNKEVVFVKLRAAGSLLLVAVIMLAILQISQPVSAGQMSCSECLQSCSTWGYEQGIEWDCLYWKVCIGMCNAMAGCRSVLQWDE